MDKLKLDRLVNRFLVWPLPTSLQSDECVTMRPYDHSRIGTNLMTAEEARQMLEYVLAETEPTPLSNTKLPDEASQYTDIHSCSFYCDRPECVKRQRDELVRRYVENNVNDAKARIPGEAEAVAWRLTRMYPKWNSGGTELMPGHIEKVEVFLDHKEAEILWVVNGKRGKLEPLYTHPAPVAPAHDDSWRSVPIELLTDALSSLERLGAHKDAAICHRLRRAIKEAPSVAPASEPEILSFDPTPEKRTARIRWPDGECIDYTREVAPSAEVAEVVRALERVCASFEAESRNKRDLPFVRAAIAMLKAAAPEPGK